MRVSIILQILLLLQLALLPACTSSRHQPSGDALLDLRNPELMTGDRVEAAQVAWAEVDGGARDAPPTRRAFKDLAWSSATPADIRVAILELLMADPSEEGQADSRQLARLMLPNERSREVVVILCAAAATHGWADLTPAIVRSLARPVTRVEDPERAEYKALIALHPDQPIEHIVFRVFLDPQTEPGPAGIRWDERTRTGAWEVLARIDPDETARRQLLSGTSEGIGPVSEGSRTSVNALRAGLSEFGVLPATGMELAWLNALHMADEGPRRRENDAWWEASRAAVAQLRPEQRAGLQLRHVEAVRWASITHPDWLTASRSQLLEELHQRLAGRRVHRRTAEKSDSRPVGKERLRDWEEQLVWGDLVTILAADTALQDGLLRTRLFDLADVDRRDTTTEFGGVIEATSGNESMSADGGEGFQLVPFVPRARDRTSDTRFVASDDMIRFSDRSLVHFHLQVQRARNHRFAGPSDADMDYCRRSGRTCMVFTSIDIGVLGADIYQPDGAVIDLGEVRR